MKLSMFFIKWVIISISTSFIVFFTVRSIPGSPVEQMLFAYQMPLTAENISILEAKWGLDKPLWQQYFSWFTHFICGDWGRSILTQNDIRQELISKMPYSLILGLGGIILSAITAYLLGFFAALNNNGFCDKLSRFLSVFSQTVPEFISAVLIIYLFGVKLKLVNFFISSTWTVMLTAITLLALYSVGSLARVVKTQFKMQMNQTYVIFALSRGLSKEYVLFRHTSKPVLRNLFAIISARMAWVWGGSALLEFIFGIPGISYFLIDSMKAKDYFVLQSYIMLVMLWMFLIQLLFNALSQILFMGTQHET